MTHRSFIFEVAQPTITFSYLFIYFLLFDLSTEAKKKEIRKREGAPTHAQATPPD
jgi:hypothetical protein